MINTCVGLDIGSSTIGMVILKGQEIIKTELQPTGFSPVETAKKMMPSFEADITSTGYGRHAAKADFAHRVITEIKAHALGVTREFPHARTILDIGGQDTKVITLDGKGKAIDFLMNDKCSAGTGKFLEIMSAALGYNSINDFCQDSINGTPGVKVTSMCTVFAESEAISLLHNGYNRRDIGLALHNAIAEKAAGTLQRTGYNEPVIITGGVTRNSCLVSLLEHKLNCKVLSPENPQLIGALGAALAGMKAVNN